MERIGQHIQIFSREMKSLSDVGWKPNINGSGHDYRK
jgi:hypothetical protein